ncbi:hypothetical protein SLS62_009857 [Diatrype stigma]|uniref:Mid2 domain-containing protein n=1 Tax=Diatrype stigma TaxID=117547 RepID=A0AAN9UCP4_9PEZI
MASSLVRLTVVLGCCAIAGINADGTYNLPAAVAVAAAAADSDNWGSARETLTDSLDPLGWTPKPTAAPDSSSSNSNDSSSGTKNKHALELELRKDDDEDEDDDDGDSDAEYPTTCGTGYSPGGALAPNREAATCDQGSFCTADLAAQRVGCCAEGDAGRCSIATACVDSAAARFLRQRADSKTLSCTDRKEICLTFSYVVDSGTGVYDGFQMFKCTRRGNDRTITVQQPASFDYSSATTDLPIPTITRTAPPGEATRTTTDPTTTFPTSDQGTRTATTTNPNSGLPTTSTTASGDSSSSSLPASPPQDVGGSSMGATSTSNRTGTIVGGVVGGVGGAALIATAVLFLLYRRRKRDQRTQPDGSSGTGTGPDLGATYYPGPQDPPLHPTQYGHEPLSSPPMGQVSPSNNNDNSNLAAAAIPPTATSRSNTRRTVSSRTPSSFLAAATRRAMSPKSADDDGGDAVSPISSRPSSSSAGAPESPHWQQQQQQMGGLSPASPSSSSMMPPVQYNRFSPPPPEHFQAYRPYPGT